MAKTILNTIVDDLSADLCRRKQQVSVASLESMPGFERIPMSLARGLKDETQAIRRLSVIAEIKRRSPSRGRLRESFEPAGIARSYELAGAKAISVLTEENHFEGSLSHLAEVRAAVNLPVLRKDFITDPYQIFEARAFGADAILLIATLLERQHLQELIAAAQELGLSCLVELYDEHELDRIDMDIISILGVNNRNLHSFEVDITRAPRILARIPEHIVRVAESGLGTGADLVRMQESGIDAVLIGEALIIETDPGEALNRLHDEYEQELSSTE